MDFFPLDMGYAKGLLPPRPETGAKWNFGRLLAVCGCAFMPGAAVLACRAAVRSGVGLVRLASVPEVCLTLAAAQSECTLCPLPAGQGGVISREAAPTLLGELSRCSALLCGCGLSATEDTYQVLQALLQCSLEPAVIDADGLNLLAKDPDMLLRRACDVIVTPHIFEMARLLGTDPSGIASPEQAAEDFARRYGVVTVLKGESTFIASPEGGRAVLCAPNSGLSKGGSGDVLSGLIAGLAAQGLPAFSAACLGVYLHSRAAALARKSLGARGMLPGDVIGFVPSAFLELEGQGREG